MAPWWLSCSTAVLLLLVQTNPVIPQYCSAGVPGIPGVPGTFGPNGLDGAKGEKGDPGEAGQPIRGQKGSQGMQGPPGRPGLKGEAGLPGPSGSEGQDGEKGQPFNPSNEKNSFFSYKLVATDPPDMNTTLQFNTEMLPELEEQFKGESLTDGTYTCRTEGIYFFSYHISAKNRVCMNLMKNGHVHTTLCDAAEGYVVSSGSVVLKLEVGDTVSLMSIRYNNIVTSSSTSHTFTGFLLFPTA